MTSIQKRESEEEYTYQDTLDMKKGITLALNALKKVLKRENLEEIYSFLAQMDKQKLENEAAEIVLKSKNMSDLYDYLSGVGMNKRVLKQFIAVGDAHRFYEYLLNIGHNKKVFKAFLEQGKGLLFFNYLDKIKHKDKVFRALVESGDAHAMYLYLIRICYSRKMYHALLKTKDVHYIGLYNEFNENYIRFVNEEDQKRIKEKRESEEAICK